MECVAGISKVGVKEGDFAARRSLMKDDYDYAGASLLLAWPQDVWNLTVSSVV